MSYAGPRQLRRLLDAVMSLGSDLDLPTLLRHIVEAGRDLIGAQYAALGVVDPDQTYLDQFITSGIDDEGRERIGALPKGHGILGVLIEDPRPLRLPDLSEHPARYGFPPGHPPMRSFLGVPLYVHGEVFGNLYFTEKLEGEVFSDIDEELAVALAAAAAITIENARLQEQTRELSVLEDRERLARDLHDTVIQQIFATGLAMHTTIRMAADPELQARLVSHVDDLDEIIRTLRSAVFQLEVGHRTPRGLRERIDAVTTDAARALGFDPLVHVDGPLDTVASDQVCADLLSVLREALSNTARHAQATEARVTVVVTDAELVLEIVDDGVGLDPDRTAGNGLRNLERRARNHGGSSAVGPAPGGGTHLRWIVPLTG